MTKKLYYIVFFVSSIAGIVSLLALQNSARAYMQCEILGYEVRLYDGSWTEYGNSVGVPISNPAGTIWGKG